MSIIAGLFNYQRQTLLNGGLDQFYVRTLVTSGVHTVTPTDTIIACSRAGTTTVTLPSIASNLKRHQRLLVVIDEGGNGDTFGVIITPDALDEIDNLGAGNSFTINWDNGAVILYSENTTPGWHILDRPPSAAVSGAYIPVRPGDWDDADPTTVAQALDRLAYAYFIAHGPVPVLP